MTCFISVRNAVFAKVFSVLYQEQVSQIYLLHLCFFLTPLLMDNSNLFRHKQVPRFS